MQAIRCGTFLYRGWNRTREIQKPLVFGGVLFHISFAVERNMAAGGRKAGHGCSPQSENRKRAVGDAGPYGGIDESAPVFEGAPMRAVGDAGPYGGIDESAPVFKGAPMRAVGDAGPYEGAAIRVRSSAGDSQRHKTHMDAYEKGQGGKPCPFGVKHWRGSRPQARGAPARERWAQNSGASGDLRYRRGLPSASTSTVIPPE